MNSTNAMLTLNVPFDNLEDFGKFTQMIISSNQFTVKAEHDGEVMECVVSVGETNIGTKFI